jgi:Protein of unknown function (DUF3147)
LIEEYILRFIVGGLAVSGFAVLGDIFRPRSFAGLFAAAPSIAIATLLITVSRHGWEYAAVEGRSMILGAAALCVYSVVVFHLLRRSRFTALLASLAPIAAWLAVALGLAWMIFG